VDYDDIDIDFSFDEYRESLRITNTFGFDILTTLTQSCINYQLRCLWKASQTAKSILFHWHFDKYFEASFGAPQIQLPSGNGSDSVILYVTIREGSLTCLDRHKKLIGLVDFFYIIIVVADVFQSAAKGTGSLVGSLLSKSSSNRGSTSKPVLYQTAT